MTLRNPKYKWDGLEVGEEMLAEQEAADEAELVLAAAEGRTSASVAFEATPVQREQVKAMATAGVPVGHICLMVRWPHNGRPVTYKTLVKHFQNELFEGSIQANTKVIGSLYASAMAGNVAAQIFWAKTRCGFREVERHEVTGKDGAPLSSGVVVVPATATPEEWEATVGRSQRELAESAADFIGDAHSTP